MPRLVKRSHDSFLVRWGSFYSQATDAELVCLGSSRVHRHCNPEIISGITHLKTEVIAAPGAKIDMFEKLYYDYLQRNKRPKVLLVGIDLTGLDSLIILPFPEYFFPFMSVKSNISEMNEFNVFKYHKALGYFYYKEQYIDMMEYPEVHPHINGFLVRDEKWNLQLETLLGKFPNGFPLNVYQPTMKKIFQFMEKEKEAGVLCIGFISPEFNEVWKYELNRKQALKEVYRYADSVKIPIWNFSDSSYKVCFNREIFYNSQHLNKVGSTIFSRDLSDSVLRYQGLLRQN